MFSLIITIISIALVAALSLATVYYGGSAYAQSNARATATRYILQGQQVLGAAELFKADTGRWPDNLGEMVSNHYLRSEPVNVAQGGQLLSTASAEDAAVADRWTVVKAGVPVYRLLGVPSDACLAVNEKTVGVAGVLKQLRASWTKQCYSPTAGAYVVIVNKDPASLLDAMPEAVTLEELPEPGSARWVIRPGSREVSAVVLPMGYASPTDTVVPLAFDNQAATAPVSYTNTTGAPLTFNSAPSVIGASAFTATTDCPAQLAAGQSCTTQVAFNPGLEPAYAAALVFDTNAARTEVPLSGNGLPKVNPPSIASSLPEFTPAKLGVPSVQTFTLTNIATTPLVCPTPASITGEQADAFSASSACPASLSPGASCAVTVTFMPAQPGAQAALLTLPCHTTAPVTVPLAAIGLTLQEAKPSVAQYDFGGIPMGEYLDHTVGLDNTGSALLHLLSLPHLEDDATAAFSLAANTCPATLAAGQGCDVTVRFAPTALGQVAAVLAIDTDASGSPQRITLGGLGLPVRQPEAQLSATAFSFGGVPVNTASTLTVTLSNTGGGVLALTPATLTAGTNASFQLGLSTCGTGLAGGASCTTSVTFLPTVAGAVNGELRIDTSAGTQWVSLSGAGLKAGAAVEASGNLISTLSFPDTAIGGGATTLSVAVRNTGNLGLLFATPGSSVTGSPFSVTDSTCNGATVNPNATCVISVTFTPVEIKTYLAGNYSLSLLMSNASASPITLSGKGIAAPPISVTITANTTNFNLYTLQANPGTVKDYVVTINSGVIVSSTSTGSPAFTTGALPAGSTVKIVNNGLIQGMGGAGGSGSGPRPGLAGGTALQTAVALTVDNTSGYIFGGGGGGGGYSQGAGFGGGGGAGGGAGGGGGYPGSPGTSGISGAGGLGGLNGTGYRGGEYGLDGGGYGLITESPYGASGPAGAAVVKGTNSVTWLGGNVAARVKGAK